jgi:hypothetical protein
MLIKQKPFVKAFHDDNGQDMLAWPARWTWSSNITATSPS